MDTVPPHADNGNSPLFPPAAGVYKITCIANKKLYIGSTVNLRMRQAAHVRGLQQNKHINPYLQRAWNKYGPDAFVFEVLELVLLPELLTAREQYWFDTLKPFGKRGFNIVRQAGSCLGIKRRPETIEKLRERAKVRTPARIAASQRLSLRRNTPEQIAKMRESKRRNPTVYTPSHLERLRQAGFARKQTPQACAKVTQALMGHVVSARTIQKICEGNGSLTTEQVAIIRFNIYDCSQAEYARRFEVSPSVISEIVAGTTYQHVTREHLPGSLATAPSHVFAFRVLSPSQAARIKFDADGLLQREYAEKYGVSLSLVNQIRNGLKYKHVTREDLPGEYSANGGEK